ncbi:MAG: hypothetical protein R2769_13950 [Saprospiraceae bacterium]
MILNNRFLLLVALIGIATLRLQSQDCSSIIVEDKKINTLHILKTASQVLVVREITVTVLN